MISAGSVSAALSMSIIPMSRDPGCYGIRNSDLMIMAPLILISAAAVTLLVLVFTFVMSGGMKKMSAYMSEPYRRSPDIPQKSDSSLLSSNSYSIKKRQLIELPFCIYYPV